MKKAITTIAVFMLLAASFVTPLQAQRKVLNYLPKYEQEPYHFGFLLGFNSMMYTIQTVEDYQSLSNAPSSWPQGTFPTESTQSLYVYNIESQKCPGFTVGIIGSKRLGRYFDLRLIPTLSFGERRINYTIAVQNTGGNIDPESGYKTFDKAIFTTFVEFPLHVKYRSKRLNNIGAYLIGGVNPKLDLASQKSNKATDAQGNEFINNLVTRKFDCALELGTGFDIYNQWFKMGMEVKMSYGIMDIVKGDSFIYTAPIKKLTNKMFQVSLTFE